MPDWSLMDISELPFLASHGLSWKTLNSFVYVDPNLLFRFFYDTLVMAIESCIAGSMTAQQNQKLHVRLWPLISKKVVPEKIFFQVSCVYSFALLSAL